MKRICRAVEFFEYGDADVLHVTEHEVPEPGAGQVRIAVRAAGVNPVDWKVRSGAMAELMPVRFPAVPGVDMAGVVECVGPGVTDFVVGDEVFGKAAAGSYTELALANLDAIAAKPEAVSWEVAAALPVAGTTAHHALAQLGLKQGDTILIDGAAGGVGTIAVQLARHRGLTVIGTAGPRNHDHLRSLGAVPVTYGSGLPDRVRAVTAHGVDAAVDAAGHGSLPALVELTGDPDRVITLADPSAESLGVRFAYGEPDGMPGILNEVAALVATGTITMPIARTYPLTDAAAAHRESQAGHVRGKLVLAPI
ncbi:NADP-dependent oxidoreductase [Actinomadura nitritigenes]|uniref:NADP-dependent oxidoreductase n=1 Tax=Actinomadura nitritigenes TaxID=134602 RepID=A0ABS3RE74_9ACTN|nr:NADP-dependent oxidoreductase [Actinomadura nitritigenes]MBO2444528.1 NADP-dependent oxidoreductase [Actinomadura nitritigenes]